VSVKYLHTDLGHRTRGDVVEVTLTSGANVRLLNTTNFSNYKAGRRYQYHGGLATKSPARIVIPSSGHWHVAVDMQGLRGSTRASVRVRPASSLRPAPVLQDPVRRVEPIDEILENALASRPPSIEVEYDVFISHASEDKDAVARPLALALQEAGITVWYDEFTLRIGDSLRRNIDQGIAKSRFGLVILSPSFFAKGWPQYELDGLVTRTVSGKQVMLPVWHELTADEVAEHSPSLADKVARDTAEYSIAEIAAEIAEVIIDKRRAA
jgi:hypothetical protein